MLAESGENAVSPLSSGWSKRALIMAISPIHLMTAVQTHARLLRFTDQYEQLDCAIFGCIIFPPRAEYLQFLKAETSSKITKKDAFRILRTAGGKLLRVCVEATTGTSKHRKDDNPIFEASHKSAQKKRLLISRRLRDLRSPLLRRWPASPSLA
jgi:hypothetical protein